MDVCSDVTRLQPTPKSSLDDPKWVLEQTTFKAWSFFLLDFRNDLMTLYVEDFENLIPLAFRKCKYQKIQEVPSPDFACFDFVLPIAKNL